MKAEELNQIFESCIEDYHETDDVDQPEENPYEQGEFNHTLYAKCWVDTVQWHLEDLIRDPDINPVDGMALKRRIDASNQLRTDKVEEIDDHFLEMFRNVSATTTASLNTESPAWVVDRLSILALKIFHMREQAQRDDAPEELRSKSFQRLSVLLEQQKDLSHAFDQLMDDYASGNKVMKAYRQMKLYNDPETNPVLYKK